MVAKVLGSLLLNVITSANTSGLVKTDKAIRKTSNSLRRISKETGLLGKLSGKLFGGFSIYTAKNLFDSYLQFEKDIGAMRSRFYAITQNEQQATQEFEYIRKLATDTALDIKNTADSYSIFYSATRKALGPEGTRDVFENWTRVSRVLHLTDHQFERVTYALREMASKGAIYSQDLRMQIGTHVPNAMGLAQKAAEEMGFTGTDWFEKLQKAAKGNVSMTAEFVRRFSRQAGLEFGSEEAFRKAMEQPDALAKRISNIGYNFMVDFSKAGGSYMIVKILQNVSDFLTGIDYYAITDNLGKIAKVIGDIFQYIPQILTILKNIALSLLIFKGIGLVKTLAGMTKASMFLLRGGRAGYAGLGALLKFGPKGEKLANFLLRFVGSGALKTVITGGLKSALTTVLGASGGPLGLILSAVLWIPDIAKIIKDKFGVKSSAEALTAGLKSRGINLTSEQLFAIKDQFEKNKNIKSQLELDYALAKAGYNQLIPHLNYENVGNITISVENFGDFDAKRLAVEIAEKQKHVIPKPHKLTEKEKMRLGIR